VSPPTLVQTLENPSGAAGTAGWQKASSHVRLPPGRWAGARGTPRPHTPQALPYLDDEAVHAAGSAPGGRVLPDGAPGHPHRPEDLRVGDEDEEAGEQVAEDEEGEDVERGLPAGGFPGDAASGAVGLGAVAAPLGQGGRGEHQGVRPDAQQQHSGVAGGEPVACSRGVGVRMASHGRGAVSPSCPRLQHWGRGPGSRLGLPGQGRSCSHGGGRATPALTPAPRDAQASPWPLGGRPERGATTKVRFCPSPRSKGRISGAASPRFGRSCWEVAWLLVARGHGCTHGDTAAPTGTRAAGREAGRAGGCLAAAA